MYICICNSVSENTINHCIDKNGYSLSDIQKLTKAGTCCGCCIPEIQKMIKNKSVQEENIIENNMVNLAFYDKKQSKRNFHK